LPTVAERQKDDAPLLPAGAKHEPKAVAAAINQHKVVILRLNATALTDAGLAHVGKVSTLLRLYLEQTAVTDAGLQHLVGLKELEYLNLYGTAVSDTGLERLPALAKLKQVFVSQTRVTPAGIAKLRQAVPGLQVVPDPAQDRQRAQAA